MGITSTSIAAGVGVAVENKRFQTGAEVIPRKILIIGTYDPLKDGGGGEEPLLLRSSSLNVTPNEPIQVFSAEHVGSLTGFGFMLHRLAMQAFAGSGGVETWILPMSEADVAFQATGSIEFDGPALSSGTIYLYIANDAVPVSVASDATADVIAEAVVSAVNSIKELPVTAEQEPEMPIVKFTSKSAGPWGNDISICLNLGLNQALPDGITATITDMFEGSGIPDISRALDALGTGDSANEEFFTDVVHGYGKDTITLDAISTYVGAGNVAVGLYDNLVSRPFRALTGDISFGSAGLNALITLGDSRKLDRANGVICVPGSASHPSEIAAQVIGHMARINSDRAEEHYLGVKLIDIHPGEKADRWTSDYASRDTAVKSGISPTRIQSGVVALQNVVTFYHPDDVPVSSNGYRSMRNISILQNILANIRTNFEREKWQGISIVADTNAVTNIKDRKKARDIDSVIDDLAALAKSFESQAWIYEAAFTLEKLAEDGAVSIRDGGIGFDNYLAVILSGEGGILNTIVEFDTSISVTL